MIALEAAAGGKRAKCQISNVIVYAVSERDFSDRRLPQSRSTGAGMRTRQADPGPA